MDVVVQPSVPWMSLNDQIKKSGLFFPVDPGPSAKIGGMVSCLTFLVAPEKSGTYDLARRSLERSLKRIMDVLFLIWLQSA